MGLLPDLILGGKSCTQHFSNISGGPECPLTLPSTVAIVRDANSKPRRQGLRHGYSADIAHFDQMMSSTLTSWARTLRRLEG